MNEPLQLSKRRRWPKVAGSVIGILLLLWIGYKLAAQPWLRRWGATDSEVAAALPGDEFTPNPAAPVVTQGITIHATPETIWPWIVQMGAEKGGLYTYTWIERMLACPLVNADRIHPEWQNLQVGDLVKMCPGTSGPPAYTVAAIEPERALVIGHPAQTEVEKAAGDWVDSWAIVLQPVDSETTRLLMRSRVAVDAWWRYVIEPGEFVMKRGMLRGIRERAEQ